MGVKVVIVNGLRESGKTTFEGFCKDQLGEFCKVSSIVEPVKELATICGWNGKKENKDRMFLSDLKDLLDTYNDYTFVKTRETIELFRNMAENYDVADANFLLLIDMREIGDIERAKKEFGATTVLVFNPRALFEDSEEICHSDKPSMILDYKYDCIIDNSGSLDDLKEKANIFIEKIFGNGVEGII